MLVRAAQHTSADVPAAPGGDDLYLQEVFQTHEIFILTLKNTNKTKQKNMGSNIKKPQTRSVVSVY